MAAHLITRTGLLAVAVGCAGDVATTTHLVTADVVTLRDSEDAVDADASPEPDGQGDDVPTEPDVDPSMDAPDADAPDADSSDLPHTDLPDSPDVEPDPVDVSDTPEAVDTDELPDVEDSDIGDVEDSDIEDGDIEDGDIEDSEEPDVPPDPGDTDVPDVVVPPTPLVLGTLAGAAFTPLPDGVDFEITQGPQGGIHLEVGIDVTWDSEEAKLSGVLSCRTRLADKDVGFNETPNFILYRAPEGTYRSIVIPVYFQDFDAAVYVNQNVAVSCMFTIGEVALQDGAVVHLVDLF
ncbi:MAG: hypothetical protein IV100_25120 [Myxococcales bacterium]|nr:hypothetical protein [Myxococcales bacterium]